MDKCLGELDLTGKRGGTENVCNRFMEDYLQCKKADGQASLHASREACYHKIGGAKK